MNQSFLCPHGLNRQACLQCFHAKPAEPAPGPRRDPALQAVPPAAAGIIGQIRTANPLRGPLDVAQGVVAVPAVLAAPAPGADQLPGQPQPVQDGRERAENRAEALRAGVHPKVVERMGAQTPLPTATSLPMAARAGVPMIGDQGALGPTQGAPPPRVVDPVSVAQSPESHRYDESGLWIPPVRKQVIDSLPRDPRAGGGAVPMPAGTTIVAPTGQQFR